jgi:plasmid stabilization system protein ParE
MTHTVRLGEEADRDLSLAAGWYEQQRAGLGKEFLDATLETIQRIAEQPLSFPSMHRGTRRALIARFPFGVYFLVEQLRWLSLSPYCMGVGIHAIGRHASK